MTPAAENWLALSLVEGLGQKTLRHLLDRFGSVEALLAAPPEQLSRLPGLGTALAGRIARARQTDAFRMERRLVAEHGTRLLTLDDPDYPALLRQIAVPPPLLYGRGVFPLPEGLYLAVVGTRRATRYGERVTRRLIEEVAAQVPTLVVVSGLARGIDTVAHEQALACGCPTVAVLGGGLARVYPPENAGLAGRIAAAGALLSEFPMTAPPLGRHFPIRNRIISGLSSGVLITEAGERSGAMITAGFGLNHNREVFAVPGDVDRPGHAGANRLIQKAQAKLVRSGRELLDELALAHPVRPVQLDWLAPQGDAAAPGAGAAPAGSPGGAGALAPGLSPRQREVVTALQDGPRHPDDLAAATGIPVERLLGLLLELELAGEICQTSDNMYAVA